MISTPRGALIFPTIVLTLILISGLLNAFFPRKMWKTFESWKATKEPTDAYFMSRRISGILAVIMVITLFVFPYIMSRS